MIIEIARLLGRAVEPPLLLVILVLASMVATIWQRWHLAMLLQATTLAILVLIGILPGGAWLALPLEQRFPGKPFLPAHVDGIIALGGTERVAASAAWDQPIFSDPAPIVALIALARQYPEAKLVFSGGAHPRNAESPTEADIVREFLGRLNIDGSRILYESHSHNTLENALFSRDMIHPTADEHWVLVTEAISMPRAVAVFRHAGWNVIPYPAGYLTQGRERFSASLDILGGFRLASVAAHEWGGLLAYRLMGYTDELMPQ
jgi:uncharacterized SAM-binding protein YcdF (DUF218 family)